SISFVNTAKYLVVHEGEIDFTDEIKPHHGDRVFERDVVKRLVESVDLVNSLGGLKAARSEAHKDCFVYNQPLLAAIAAYESIYGGGDE
ncbi:TPA: hypothetical protein ACSBV0_003854, partial [Acinetobacter baumannii]